MGDKVKTRASVDNERYAAFAGRIIRAYGRRVGNADEVDLAEMLKIQVEMDDAVQAAVDGMRARGMSWQYIANGAGITRSSAADRWGGRFTRRSRSAS